MSVCFSVKNWLFCFRKKLCLTVAYLMNLNKENRTLKKRPVIKQSWGASCWSFECTHISTRDNSGTRVTRNKGVGEKRRRKRAGDMKKAGAEECQHESQPRQIMPTHTSVLHFFRGFWVLFFFAVAGLSCIMWDLLRWCMGLVAPWHVEF